MGFAVSRRQPKSIVVRHFLERIFRESGHRPRALVSDQGRQFVAKDFVRWCRRRGIRQRFGAIGKYGSLAVIERCIRTLKEEYARRLVTVPFCLGILRQELGLYFNWYNGHRPHMWLRGATPDEVYHRRRQAVRAPRFEPRPLWPRSSPCASPMTLIRGQPGVTLTIKIRFLGDHRSLPIVTLRRAA